MAFCNAIHFVQSLKNGYVTIILLHVQMRNTWETHCGLIEVQTYANITCNSVSIHYSHAVHLGAVITLYLSNNTTKGK